EVHIVFASPGTIAAYQKEGHFADGSVLVKEVVETATDEMTTGTVSDPQKLTGWFVMVLAAREQMVRELQRTSPPRWPSKWPPPISFSNSASLCLCCWVGRSPWQNSSARRSWSSCWSFSSGCSSIETFWSRRRNKPTRESRAGWKVMPKWTCPSPKAAL